MVQFAVVQFYFSKGVKKISKKKKKKKKKKKLKKKKKKKKKSGNGGVPLESERLNL